MFAANCFRCAAESGHATAQFNLGHGYAEGNRVAKDSEQAVSWY